MLSIMKKPRPDGGSIGSISIRIPSPAVEAAGLDGGGLMGVITRAVGTDARTSQTTSLRMVASGTKFKRLRFSTNEFADGCREPCMDNAGHHL
jgi:hypothetical protein